MFQPIYIALLFTASGPYYGQAANGSYCLKGSKVRPDATVDELRMRPTARPI
jgi:hypothetical protein